MIMTLTPHFALSEFTHSQTAARLGITNAATSPTLIANIRRTATMLEKVRVILGKPILVSSGYRCPELNAAVGGSQNSAHVDGLAVDFTCPGFGSPRDICYALSPFLDQLEIDQMIFEFTAWVHLGLSADTPRLMALTIDGRGTREGIA